MKTRMNNTLACVSLLALMNAAGAATISFNQYDWLADGGGYTAYNSEWGYAGLSWSASDASMFSQDADGYYGFVNIYTEVPGGGSNWAVQNVPMRFSTPTELAERVGDGYEFNLGTPRGTLAPSMLGYQVTVSAVPATDTGGRVGGFSNFGSVTQRNILVGGVGSEPGDPDGPFSGGTGQAAPNIAQNYDGQGDGAFPLSTDRGVGQGAGVKTAKVQVKDDDVVKVNEKKNHCSPGSVTRGIHALKSLNNAMPLTDNVATTVSTLATNMGTTEANGTATIQKMVDGKNAYVNAKNLNITTARTTDPCAVFDTLVGGGVAEMIVNWGKNGLGQGMGAHAVFVAEIEKTFNADGTLKSWRARVIDDPTQDGVAAENRSYWLSFGADNSLKGRGTGARLMGFMTETYTVPTPGAGALLTLAGLIAARRRRAA